MSVFPWALFRSTKSAVKPHTLLDLRGNIPIFMHISDGKMHDVNALDLLIPETGTFYIMDRRFCLCACANYQETAKNRYITLQYSTGIESDLI